MTSNYDLVVLAGGGAARLGGVDKVTLPLAGLSSLNRVLLACQDAQRIVVVGPERGDVTRPVTWCLEDPPGSGPLAAVAAALRHLAADVVLVVAGDMPLVGAAKAPLLNALEANESADAAVLCDDGVRQPLAAAYRRQALVRRMDEVLDVRDKPVRLLLDQLRLVEVPGSGAAADCDTWDDVYRIEEELRRAR